MMEINTSPECISKMLSALPFADNDAGLPETAHLIELLRDEVYRLETCLEEISNPKKLTSHGDPTVLRDHARKALQGGKP